MSLFVCGFVASCGAVPATPEQARLGERAMLQPFLSQRSVVCGELVIEATPNFHLHVSQPGHDGRTQRLDIEQKDALVERTWTNLTGAESGWFTVTISEPSDPIDVSGKMGPHTKFRVMNRFVLRTRERGAMTLSARASGDLVAVQEAVGPARKVRKFAIVDGSLER